MVLLIVPISGSLLSHSRSKRPSFRGSQHWDAHSTIAAAGSASLLYSWNSSVSQLLRDQRRERTHSVKFDNVNKNSAGIDGSKYFEPKLNFIPISFFIWCGDIMKLEWSWEKINKNVVECLVVVYSAVGGAQFWGPAHQRRSLVFVPSPGPTDFAQLSRRWSTDGLSRR